ncbi:MAG: inorganic phosphate transporter [Limisphaerales bacterium]
MTAILLFITVLALAFFNGANDVSKGIATLVGSGVTRMKTAVVWGAAWTVGGAMGAVFAAQGLARAFSGSGLVSPLPFGFGFLGAVAGGSLAWIWFATRTGLPVSTTHAITGALVGAGMVAVGTAGLHWHALLEKFALPLAVSPLLALALMFVCFPILNFAFGQLQQYCVCVNHEAAIPTTPACALALNTAPSLVVSETGECAQSLATVWRLNPVDGLHWFSAGATSFARGLNDAPKILAIGLAANLALGCTSTTGFVLIGLAMGLGSLVAGFRVTETLAQKVTAMSPAEGLIANLVTSFLVILASTLALPVSTTHVSSGAIIGLGLRRNARAVQWRTVRDLLLAWGITLPAAGILAAVLYWLQHTWL